MSRSTSTTVNDPQIAWLDSIINNGKSGNPNVCGMSANFPVQTLYTSNNPSTTHSEDSNRPSGECSTPAPQTPSQKGPGCATTAFKGSSSSAPGRRIRPKIALDPSQPPTAQGKARARVYVACDQCRTRKTRCDGAKPVCYNCRKRPPEVGECSYDAQPRRRGQDKVPGTRAHSAGHRRDAKRKRTSREDYDDGPQSGSDSTSRGSGEDEGQFSLFLQPCCDSSQSSEDEYDPFPLVDLDSSGVDVEYELGHTSRRYKPPEIPIPARPSLQFSRETWWDALITFYATEEGATDMNLSLTPDRRLATVQHVLTDLRALFRSSVYWVSFINIPRFFDNLLHPTRRASMQPAFVLSALAVGVFSQSSDLEGGHRGRVKALKLVDYTHSALQASLASGWVDIGLIQAAWLLVYFEIQCHPKESAERAREAILLLDSLIQLFSLTTLDADLWRTDLPSSATVPDLPLSLEGFLSSDNVMLSAIQPSTGYSPFVLNQSQLIKDAIYNAGDLNQSEGWFIPPMQPLVHDNITFGPSTASSTSVCNCASFSLGRTSPTINDLAPTWAGTPMWPTNVSEGEYRKEECRRLVWASVMVTASMNAYCTELDDIRKNQLWIKDPSNYALLFPGEALGISCGAPVLVNNIWTLLLRAMLLLHLCVRKRADLSLCDSDRATFAMQAWLEIDAIDNALNLHTCNLEGDLGFQARQMLFSARMCVSHEFQRYIPQVTTTGGLFYRDKAEHWLKHQILLADKLWGSIGPGPGKSGTEVRKSLVIYWFTSHVAKCLAMWNADPSLTMALEASKTFSCRAEYLMMFWPSPEQRKEWQGLRYRLVDACIKSGIPPPDATLPCPLPCMRNDDA